MNTLEKINNGTIRIENGRLIGFDKGESIDLVSFVSLIEFAGKFGIVEALSSAINGASNIHASAQEMDEGPDLQFLNDRIIPDLPDSLEIHILSLIRETFKK
jgi:hypothetical protein